MRNRLRNLAAATVLAMSAAWPAFAQQSEADRAQQQIFEKVYRQFIDRLNGRWQSEIVPRVLAAVPSMDPSIVRSVHIYDPQQSCQFRIQIDTSTQEVPLSQTYYAITSMYLQPFLLYVAGYKQFLDLEAVVETTINSMERQTASFHRECRNGDPARFSFQIPAFAFFRSREEYDQVVKYDAQNDPHVVDLAEKMASDAIAFVLLHELGHAVTNSESAEIDFQEDERNADRFAAKIFARTGNSTTYGAVGLAIYLGSVSPLSRKPLACRIVELLAQEATSSMHEKGPMAERSLRLKRALQQHFARSCSS